jgi:peptidoglycan/LPS O-acetylase OafA/YrhL
MQRIKSIDGLRAFSIIMVLIGHTGATMPRHPVQDKILFFLGDGGLAVRIFFAISGYLITKLLIIEQSKTGTINLKKFYIRRVFRIFPVFYLFIAVVFILKLTVFPTIINNNVKLLVAGSHIWNYMHLLNISNPSPTYENGNLVLGHFWTLAMEEQFYLLWPIAFWKTSKPTLIKAVTFLILLMPFIRVATYFLMPSSRGQIGMMLQTGGDTILVGCLAALIESTPAFAIKYRRHLDNKLLLVVSILIMFVISPYLQKVIGGSYTITVGMSITNICIMFFILWTLYIPSGFANLLNTKFMIQVGVLSYSIYIWQQLFLLNTVKSVITTFPYNIILALITACASYYLFEKPILKFKNRYKAV